MTAYTCVLNQLLKRFFLLWFHPRHHRWRGRVLPKPGARARRVWQRDEGDAGLQASCHRSGDRRRQATAVSLRLQGLDDDGPRLLLPWADNGDQQGRPAGAEERMIWAGLIG